MDRLDLSDADRRVEAEPLDAGLVGPGRTLEEPDELTIVDQRVLALMSRQQTRKKLRVEDLLLLEDLVNDAHSP